MLNLPEPVKMLFRMDGVQKNFRVHFLNGEMADITNSQIVTESVHFTESVCSQDSLKFGLTEASMIEFETVGVANMRRMLIECSTEIDVSSLTAAQISAIEAGSWDGELVQPELSGLDYTAFRVPYGVFRVDSCPRNQQAMAHRRVQAYSIGPSTLSENPFEAAKLSILAPGGRTYDPQTKAFLHAIIGYSSPQLMESAGYQKSVPYMIADASDRSRQATLHMIGGSTKVFDFVYRLKSTVEAQTDAAVLYAADLHGYDYQQAVDDFAVWLEDYGVDAAASGYDDMVALVKSLLPWAPAVLYGYRSSGDSATEFFDTVYLTASNEAIYPYRPGLRYRIELPTVLYIMTTREGGGVDAISRNPVSADLYQLTDTATPTALDSVAVSIQSTLEQTRSIGGTSRTCWSFTNAVSLLDFANGFLEISAAFGRVDRSGNIVFDRLSPTPSVSIGLGDISDLWWDESNVAPIGSVVYTYKDGDGNDQTATCKIGSGAGVYDMTSNALLKVLSSASASQIETLIRQNFRPYVVTLGYTPVHLNIRAMPWIESADALQITTEDGIVVSTYVMRHEVDGIQALFADIESHGETE